MSPSRVARAHIAVTVIAVATALVALLTYWSVRPYDTVTATGEAFMVGPDVVPIGGTVKYQRESLCIEDYEVLTERWAELHTARDPSALIRSYAISTIITPKADARCIAPSVNTTILPNSLPPGEYRLRLESHTRVNPISTRTVTTYSPWFTIAAP